ncbi:conjugal transfer protein TraO [Pseudomonas asuensis]|uniref:TraO protein n=1 Tax=Pseudomonas asuensis TaxID=1825787 RepID=A0ABQ2H1D7_9PSED|nr:conjugal transfer protein TraO [Pseudomonas asuensis]GGM26071.1 traO protein [Pseudomonas asuensis]
MKAQADIGRNTKVLAIGALILVGTGLYIGFGYWQKGQNHASDIRRVQTGSATASQESPHYSQVLDRYNRKESAQAEANGDSYISVPSTAGPKDINNQQAKPTPQPEQPQIVYYQPAPQPQIQQAPSKADQKRTEEIKEQTKALLDMWVAQPHVVATVSNDMDTYAKSIRASQVTPNNTNSSLTPQPLNNLANGKVVDDFFVTPALLRTALDTDENSMVTAVVPTGKLAGAKLYAMGYKRLTNTIDMTFTSMSFNGRCYNVTAKPVDPETNRTSLSGEVNNRYFERIILPAIAAGIGRTGQLYERSSSENIITDSAVVQTYPSTPSGRNVAGTIVGGMAEQAGRVLANDAANMPQKQILKGMNETIGIQFVGGVYESNACPVDGQQGQNQAFMNMAQPASQPPQQMLPPGFGQRQFQNYGSGSSPYGSPYPYGSSPSGGYQQNYPLPNYGNVRY